MCTDRNDKAQSHHLVSGLRQPKLGPRQSITQHGNGQGQLKAIHQCFKTHFANNCISLVHCENTAFNYMTAMRERFRCNSFYIKGTRAHSLL